MKGLAAKERERKRIPTHSNITYYLYSLWKTGLKHRISVRKKYEFAQTLFLVHRTNKMEKQFIMAVPLSIQGFL